MPPYLSPLNSKNLLQNNLDPKKEIEFLISPSERPTVTYRDLKKINLMDISSLECNSYHFASA